MATKIGGLLHIEDLISLDANRTSISGVTTLISRDLKTYKSFKQGLRLPK